MPEPRFTKKGQIYVIETPDGNFNLRDFATSEKEAGSVWTIDIPRGMVNTKKAEIKFGAVLDK